MAQILAGGIGLEINAAFLNVTHSFSDSEPWGQNALFHNNLIIC